MKLAWARKVSPEFARKAIALAAYLGAPPNALMSCMAFESAETFSPSVRNRVSNATGLIQFMPYTAPKLGTSVDELARMTAEQQLDYVAKYFKPYKGKLKTIDDLYMAILWPKAVGKPSSYVLFDTNSPATVKAYAQNKGLDADKNGQITKAEAAAQPRLKLKKGLTAAYVGEVADDTAEPATDVHTPLAPEDAGDEPVQPIPAPTPTPAAPAGLKIVGDPATWWIIRRLTGMHYYSGVNDGRYGGKTAGAIAAFLNDWDERDGQLTAPKDADEFEAMRDALSHELGYAEAEHFVRPVSQARKELAPEVVKEVAPEVIPQKRNMIATAWTAVLTFLAGVYQTVSGYVSAAWDWFTGAKDQLPDAVTEPSTLGWLWGKITNLPPSLWLILIAGALAFVGYNSYKAIKKTTDDIKTGVR